MQLLAVPAPWLDDEFRARRRFHAGAGADNLTLYQFNTHRIEHQFCKTCGIESFARGVGPDGSAVAVINVACLDDAPPIDRSAIQHFDGANF